MPLPKSVVCKSCTKTYPEGWKRCPYCGHDELRARQDAIARKFMQKKVHDFEQKTRERKPDRPAQPATGASRNRRRRRRGRSGSPGAAVQPAAAAPRPSGGGQKPRETAEGGGGGRRRRFRRRRRGPAPKT